MLTTVSLGLLCVCFLGYVVKNETALSRLRRKQRGILTRLEIMEKYTGVSQTDTDYRPSKSRARK